MPAEDFGPEFAGIAMAAMVTSVEQLLSRMPLIMWATDDQLRLKWVRGGAVRMLGLDQQCGIGQALEAVFDSPDHPIIEHHRAALTGKSCSVEAEWLDRLYEIWIEPLHEQGAITGSIAIALDSTDARRAEQTLMWHSGCDAVTGALNRTELCEQMETLLAGARRRGHEFSVVYVDVDGFGSINDRFNTSVGDQVLRNVCERIAEAVPENAFTARVGADEFAVVFEHDSQGVEEFCSRLQRRFLDPLVTAGKSLHIGISVGTAVFPHDGNSVEKLLSCGAAAARHAAAMGGRRTERFSSELAVDSRQRAQIDGDLREALRRNELFLVYQPQVRIHDGSVAGVEVLLRWRKDGEVRPAWTFIHEAEESSVIIPVGEWVIDTAFAQLKKWRDEGLDPGRMAINIGARQLSDSGS